MKRRFSVTTARPDGSAVVGRTIRLEGGPMEDRDTSLAARLQKLEDIEAVRTLRMMYHQYINGGEFGRVHELFSPDGVADLDYFGRYDGVDAIREVYDLLARRPDFMIKQFITAHTVDVGDGHGTGQCHLLATQARRGTSYLVTGSYVDEYVAIDGRWVFQRMTLHVYFSVPSGVGWAGRDLHYLNPVVGELMSSLDQR
jgi:SnoaL-like domain